MKNRQNDSFQASFCAERLKALGEPLRLRIVDALRQGELTVSDLSLILESQVVNVSHHLKVLKQVELVISRREGKYIYYQLHPDLLGQQGDSAAQLDLGCCKLQVEP